MNRIIIAVFCFCSLVLATNVKASNVTIIHAGTLIAEPGKSALTKQTIIVRGDVIERIISGFKNAKELGLSDSSISVIDLSKDYVMPGFIDSHVHLGINQLPNLSNYMLTEMTSSRIDRAFSAVNNGKAMLSQGFTTVRDLGDTGGNLTFDVKKAINSGKVSGPRMLTAGSMIVPTGGQMDVWGLREELQKAFDDTIFGICDGADDCRQLIREIVKRGADVIKIKNSLGIDCDFPGGRDARFTDEELNVIVETAHDLGRKVASHAICLKGINAALKAGVDSIEHSSKMNDETIALFKKFDTYLVPTLIANVRFQEVMGAPDNNNVKTFPGHLNHLIKHFDDKLAKAIKAKVKIAFGSDAGWVEHKNAHREFTLLAKAGLTPVEVLKSTTVYSADLLGISDIAGSIAMGKSADIVATSQNPLKNASALTHVKFVMARGQVFKD